MRNLCLIALLPALTCAFFLPIPPLFKFDKDVDVDVAVDVNAFEIDLKEICPVIHFAEIELCGNTSSSTNSVPPQLCSLLSLLNHTFCQDEKAEKGEKGEKHIHENTKFNILNLSKTTEKYIEKLDEKLYKELDEKVQQYIKKVNITYSNSSSSSGSDNKNKVKFNPKDLCPVFDLIDKTFCASSFNNNKINPKDLCPLLEFVEKELCS
jgi:hypothetical protein